MAKSKTESESVVITEGVSTIPKTPTGQLFKRRAAVNLPVLKLDVDKPVFVHVTGEIVCKKTEQKADDGSVSLKDIFLVPVVNMETGELMQFVAGSNVLSTLREYKGGNNNYVGLAFEITKLPKAPGKKWHPYSVFEVESNG
jgi:hypothetical protein